MRKTVFALLTLLLVPCVAKASDHYFPSRPVGRAPFHMTGVLKLYAHGEAVGYVEVQDDAGTTSRFSMGYPMRLNGKAMRCFRAPMPSMPGYKCDEWPTDVVVGTTRVTVTYWKATLNGSTVLACDELVAAGTTPPHR